MRRLLVGLVSMGLCGIGVAWAATSVGVTSGGPALNASMQLVATIGTDCYEWNVSGKVKPAFRGPDTTVRLQCQKYSSLGTCNDFIVVGQGNCDSDPVFCGSSNTDASGNVDFTFAHCGEPSPQLDPSYFCTFVVHSSSGNGTAPCSGGFCPNGP